MRGRGGGSNNSVTSKEGMQKKLTKEEMLCQHVQYMMA